MLIAIVGPSGAGKDTLIDYARAELAGEPRVIFARRIVTRTPHASSEAHDFLDVESFSAAMAGGQFAVAWEAHGLRYAIPVEVLRHVRDGGVAIANGSRAAMPDIISAFGNVLAVHVTCRPEVLERRLGARGRESAEQQRSRLERASSDIGDLPCRSLRIDNSDDLSTSGKTLVDVIRQHVVTKTSTDARSVTATG